MQNWPFHIHSQMYNAHQCLFMNQVKRSRNSPRKGGLDVFLSLCRLLDNPVCERGRQMVQRNQADRTNVIDGLCVQGR